MENNKMRGFTIPFALILLFLIGSVSIGSYAMVSKKKGTSLSPKTTISKNPEATESASLSPTLSPIASILNAPTPTHTPKQNSTNSTTTSTPSTQSQNTGGTSGNTTSTTVPTSTPTKQTPGALITVDKTVIDATADRKDEKDGWILGPTLTVTSYGATGWAWKYPTGTNAVGFDISSAGILPGSSMTLKSHIVPSGANGTYSNTMILTYSDSNGVWKDGPTVTVKFTLIGSNDSGTISVNSTDIQAFINKKNINWQTDRYYGPALTVTSQGATQWKLEYNQSHDGYGFEINDWNTSPGNVMNTKLYILSSKPNGTYSGSVIVKYKKGDTWSDGPTVNYTINLAD